MHREVWNVCEKTWDAQRGVGCTGRFGVHREVWDAQGSLGWTGRCRMHGEVWDARGGLGRTGRCGMHREVWDALGGLGCVEGCGVHREHTGSVAGQGHLAHHVLVVPRVCRGVVAPRGDSSGISRQSCPGTSPATAARNTATGRRGKPTSHLGRRSIRLPWVSTQQLPK